MILRSWMLGLGCYCSFVVCFAGMAAALRADDPAAKPATEKASAEELRREAFVRAMKSVATELKVARLTDDREVECTLVEDSVLNWTDSARHPDLIVPGTTWIWHD